MLFPAIKGCPNLKFIIIMGACCDRPNVNEAEFKKHDNNLFNAYKLGPYVLKNRTVMAAMTRCRADPKTCIPNDLHIKYYSDRAESAGMILTECSGVSFRGNGYQGACGSWTKEQFDGWKKVVDAVHKNNSRFFLQLFHMGRAARTKDIGGQKPLAPSNVLMRIKKEGDNFVYSDEPEVLTVDGIKAVVEEFRKAAEMAKEAGFDGIEIHGANGYLVDQFLRDSSNKRTDQYGGSIENRCRFPLEVVQAVISVFGADRVGIKVSPTSRYNDMCDSDPVKLYKYFLGELSKLKIAFVEVTQSSDDPMYPNFYNSKETEQLPDAFKELRGSFQGTFIANNNLTFETASALLNSGGADLVSFARFYLANPDLIDRWMKGKPLNPPDFSTMFWGGEKGYNDYPKLPPN